MLHVLSQVTVASVNTEPAGHVQIDEPTALVLSAGQAVHDVDWATLNVLDGHAACTKGKTKAPKGG